MCYMTSRSYMMPKYKVNVTGRGVFLMGPTSGPPEHEKMCFSVLHNGRTKTCYMSSRSYVMQKHKFGITCHGTLLVGPALGHPGMKNTALMFHTLDAPKRAT
jgi:hypothetical protein